MDQKLGPQNMQRRDHRRTTRAVLATLLLGAAACGVEEVGLSDYGLTIADASQANRADVNSVLVIDADEARTSPVAHRFIHGAFGDAKFVIRLPSAWNGKLLVSAHPITGNEFTNDALFSDPGLLRGYAYAASDEGWSLATIGASAHDEFEESKRRLVQLTSYTLAEITRHYGTDCSRTYLLGFSNGGHRVKWLVEDYPDVYGGGLDLSGFNSSYEAYHRWALFARDVDIIAPRMSAIIAKRNADPNWDPNTTPLSPPLTDAQLQALNEILSLDIEVRSGFHFLVGSPTGTEANWVRVAPTILALVVQALPAIDQDYDPDGDGHISVEEAKAWDPNTRPAVVQNKLRKADVNGELFRPMIICHGNRDLIVTPGESSGYKGLVESTLGVSGVDSPLRVYMVPGVGHSAAALQACSNAGLDALDRWADYLESSGQTGALPTTVAGIQPL
jgi:hypothetical protein